MLLSNAMLDFMVEKIRGIHDFNIIDLKEKNVTDSKIKLVFKRNTLKTSVEFGVKEMAGVVYDNFLKKEHQDEITFNDFFPKFKLMLESQDKFKNVDNVEKAIDKLCEEIIAMKLKFPKGVPEEIKAGKGKVKNKKEQPIEDAVIVEEEKENEIEGENE